MACPCNITSARATLSTPHKVSRCCTACVTIVCLPLAPAATTTTTAGQREHVFAAERSSPPLPSAWARLRTAARPPRLRYNDSGRYPASCQLRLRLQDYCLHAAARPGPIPRIPMYVAIPCLAWYGYGMRVRTGSNPRTSTLSMYLAGTFDPARHAHSGKLAMPCLRMFCINTPSVRGPLASSRIAGRRRRSREARA